MTNPSDEEYVDPTQMGEAPGPSGQDKPQQTDNGPKAGDGVVPDAEQKPYTIDEPQES